MGVSGGVSVLGDLCPGGSLSWVGSLSHGEGLSQGVFVQGDLCPGGVSLTETPPCEQND